MIIISKNFKRALHGVDTWTQVGHGEDPSYFRPMNWAPEFGGRWRENFPGGGSSNINKDSDVDESLRGIARDEDFDPQARTNKINELLHGGPKTPESYVLVYECRDGESPKEKAEEIKKQLGEGDAEAIIDDTTIRIVLPDFESATSAQPRIPGSVVEKINRPKKGHD